MLAPHHLALRVSGSAFDLHPMSVVDRERFADAFAHRNPRWRLQRSLHLKRTLSRPQLQLGA